jgi:hypothetical protein
LLVPDPNNPVDLVERLQHWRANFERIRRWVLPLSESLLGQTWDQMAREIVQVVQAAA